MTERVVLPQVTVDALQWEPECSLGSECDDTTHTGDCSKRRLVADQWVPLPEPLTVKCPAVRHRTLPAECHCDGTGRIPLPEGVYDIGTERITGEVHLNPPKVVEPYALRFVPLAEGVRLRQVHRARVRREPTCSVSVGVTVGTQAVYIPRDLYDRLVSSVDGGPPWGVLNIRRQP